jgi:hypothetical protein
MLMQSNRVMQYLGRIRRHRTASRHTDDLGGVHSAVVSKPVSGGLWAKTPPIVRSMRDPCVIDSPGSGRHPTALTDIWKLRTRRSGGTVRHGMAICSIV